MTEFKDFRSLLQSVVMLWQQSAKAYAEYIENGKKFQYAAKLKVHNTAVKDLLSGNLTLIPADFQQDVADLIEHYVIWSAKWEALKDSMNPGPDDEFVFENDHRFPRQAAQKLEAYSVGSTLIN